MSKTAYTILAIIGIIAIIVVLALLVPTKDKKDARMMQDPKEESNFIIRPASVDSVDLMVLESFPVQIQAVANGNFGDGCTELNQVTQQRVGNIFTIDITTKRPKDANCTQALVPFSETIPIVVEGLAAGEYTVSVNGVEAQFALSVDNIIDLDIGDK